MTEFHADDYGLFPAQARRILQCYEKGALNGVSIMPNSPCLEQCLEMLPETGIALTVHLNLMEGRSAAPAFASPSPRCSSAASPESARPIFGS